MGEPTRPPHMAVPSPDLPERDAAALLAEIEPAEARHLFGEMSAEEGAGLLEKVDRPRAAEVLLWLSPELAGSLLAVMRPASAAAVLGALPSDERADLLGGIPEGPRREIQGLLPELQRNESERLLRYPPDSAGGLMETELMVFPAGTTVGDVLRDIRAHQERYARMGVQYLYIVDSERRLRGVAPIRALVLAPEGAPVESPARAEPVAVRDTAGTDEIADAFAEHPFVGLPVVDEQGRLLGVVNRADLREAIQLRAEEQFRLSQGIIGGEELRVMPLGLRFRRRAGWLGVNLLLCLAASAVVAANRETLARALVVAALLPVISATSGNAAMQAAAVSIRELSLGMIDTREWRRVLANEVGLAGMLAVLLGGAVGLLGMAWGAAPTVAAAAMLAMALNTVLAISIGGVLPLALRRLSIDPALASGPLSTTLADVSGFTLVFTLVMWLG